MNLRLTLVLLTLFRAGRGRLSAAQAPLVLDPAKLHLASVNAVVIDAAANRSVYARAPTR